MVARDRSHDFYLPYFQCVPLANSKHGQKQEIWLEQNRCYHHRRNEAGIHWAGGWYWSACCRPHGLARHCGLIPACFEEPASAGKHSGSRRKRRQCASRGAGRAHSITNRPRSGSGSWRNGAALPSRGRNPVARNYRGVFSAARGGVRSQHLAFSRQLGSRPRPSNLYCLGDRGSGVSVSGRDVVLASKSQVADVARGSCVVGRESWFLIAPEGRKENSPAWSPLRGRNAGNAIQPTTAPRRAATNARLLLSSFATRRCLNPRLPR